MRRSILALLAVLAVLPATAEAQQAPPRFLVVVHGPNILLAPVDAARGSTAPVLSFHQEDAAIAPGAAGEDYELATGAHATVRIGFRFAR